MGSFIGIDRSPDVITDRSITRRTRTRYDYYRVFTAAGVHADKRAKRTDNGRSTIDMQAQRTRRARKDANAGTYKCRRRSRFHRKFNFLSFSLLSPLNFSSRAQCDFFDPHFYNAHHPLNVTT